MPLKTNVGVSRKVSDNQYGSRGASVNLEVELDSTLINDPERFHERIRQVFRLAQQAIDEELGRQQGNGMENHATNRAQPSHNGNGNGRTATVTPRRMATATRRTATVARSIDVRLEKQLNFAKQLAKGIPNLGVRRLETLVQKMCGKPLAALTTLDASGLIDTLKSIKAGEIDIDAVLGETPHEHGLTRLRDDRRAAGWRRWVYLGIAA